MAIEGVDYAGDHPDPKQLKAAGKRFVVRYGGPGGSWKHLTAAEVRSLTGAGLAIVANAEGTANGLQGRSAGIAWAQAADKHFRSLGMPADRPIYLSVDFDVTEKQWPAVREALRGAASVLGLNRVGVYGGRRAIEWARRDGVAKWFWQTYAWSGGVWVKGNHIEQYRNNVSLAGGTVDLCRALTADYGQWGQPREDGGIVASLDDLRKVLREELPKAIRAEVPNATWETDSIPAPYPERTEANPNWRASSILHYGAGNAIDANQKKLPKIDSKLDGLTAKLDGLTAVATALADALNRGGANIDTAAVLGRLDGLSQRIAELAAERDEANRQIVDMRSKVADLKTQLDERDRRLAAAYAGQGN